jgi:hypothetical protein
MPGDVELTPGQQTIPAEQQFNIEVLVHAGPANQVDTVQVYLDFDPAKLEVVKLVGGTTLPVPLQSSFDNTLGRVNYAAGTFGDPVTAPFTLVTVTFRGRERTGEEGTNIVFAPRVNPRQTKVVFDGENVTKNLLPANAVVS